MEQRSSGPEERRADIEQGESVPQDGKPRRARKLPGRTRRSGRWVATVTTAAVLAGALVAVLIYQLTRPEIRRPGEELPEITRKLAKNLPEEAPLPRFTDVTEEAGLGGFSSFRGGRTSQLPEDMGSGLAWGDYDGDGDDDLFLVSNGGPLTAPPEQWAESELYENRGDGTFRKVQGFPETRIVGMAAAWGDYDLDGRLDLALTGYGTLALFHNQGEGRFVPGPELPIPEDTRGYWSGAMWGDFDNDRDLDLYVSGYVQYVPPEEGSRRTSQQYGKAVPYTLNPASYEPERNLLFRNRGDGTFDEVAVLWGVSNPAGRSLSALWHDFDADGWLDLYVANDISDNVLFLNRRETFEDVSLAAWVADYRGAMGLAAGDWNRDGDDDLFITHWVAQENALYDSQLVDLAATREAARNGEAPVASDGARPSSETSSQPSSQAATQPLRLAFRDVAVPLGLGQIALPLVGWGTAFADFDADGWLDLVIANGSTFETEDDPPRLEPQAPLLLWNQQGEHFHDLVPLNDALAVPRVGRGLAVADYDRDGDLDFAVIEHGGGVRLWRNDMTTGHGLELRLRSLGPDGRPVGIGQGATVVAWVGDTELRRSVSSASYLSQNSPTVHFGLGETPRVERLEVRWPAGETQVWTGLGAGAVWELTEGEPEPRRLSFETSRGSRAGAAGAGVAGDPASLDERERVVAFWSKHRAGMDAMKREGDCERAIGLFREALALDPEHEDARYYLANCLAATGNVDEALQQLGRLLEVSPRSHRGLKRWGTLKAMTATTEAELEAAREALERALDVNQEETGTLLVLGEIALLEGKPELAEQRFEWACRTNPRAVGGFFLRGYLAWKAGNEKAARELLVQAHEARGEDWKPEGAVAEGDVKTKQHRDETPLAHFWEAWNGEPDPRQAFAELDRRVQALRSS